MDAAPVAPHGANVRKRRRLDDPPPRLRVAHLVHDLAPPAPSEPPDVSTPPSYHPYPYPLPAPHQQPHAHRRRAPPSASFDDLPEDVLSLVLPHLDLRDLLHLRLALCASRPPTADTNATAAGCANAVLRRAFRARVARLAGVWHGMSLSDLRSTFGPYIPAAWTTNPAARATRAGLLQAVWQRRQGQSSDEQPEQMGDTERSSAWPPPPTAVARVTHLDASGLTPAVARAIADEMPHLRSLHVYGDAPGPQDPAPFAALQRLPAELGECTQLRELDIVRQGVTTVSEPVLRLQQLETLKLEMNVRLAVLPTDIGVRLRHLRYVTVTRCPVRALPASLLDRMEAVFAARDDDMRPVALCLNECAFPPGYLARAVCPVRYPLVRHRLVG